MRSMRVGSVVVLSFVVAACASGNASDDPMSSAIARASSMAGDSSQTRAGSPSAEVSIAADPSRSKSQTAPEDSPDQNWSTTEPSDDFPNDWREYPWGESNGLECPPPTGIRSDRTVIVLGDSNIREGRVQIEAALNNIGRPATIVCWGGKQLPWGIDQITLMDSLGLTPTCLVVNLGTNDLKGTEATGLADAVSLPEIRSRLQQLVSVASGVEHLILVDVAAHTEDAPSTMKRVKELPKIFESVSESRPGVTVARWSERVAGHASFISGDGVHDSDEGKSQRARLIAETVSAACT